MTGASSGIGFALALALAQKGYDLVVTAPTEAELEEVNRQIIALGRKCFKAPADVRDAALMLAIPQQASQILGQPIELAIANAGVLRYGPPEQQSLEDDMFTFGVNLIGAVHLVRAVLPAMLERRSGHLVGVGSLAGVLPFPQRPAYTASKSGLIYYFRGLALDLKAYSIPVTVVLPGYVHSPMTAKIDRMPLAWSSERAARYIVKGLEQKRATIAFPWPLVWGLRLLGLLPEFAQTFLLRRQQLHLRPAGAADSSVSSEAASS
ncbi:MAG: SDR family NAD(P)-dependent oxidoreductase [Candidatus Sericytochromatia bacterium]